MKATKRVAAVVAATAMAVGGAVAVGAPAQADGGKTGGSTRESNVPHSNIVAPNTAMKSGEKIYSTNDKYALVQQTDGNLIVYRTADNKPMWSSYTGDHPGARLAVGKDGQVIIWGKDKGALWSTHTAGQPGNWLQLMNDGQLVLWGQDGTQKWNNSYYVGALPYGPTLRPGHYLASPNRQYFLVNQEDGNLVLVNKARKPLWATNTEGHKGAFAQFQKDGNFVVYDAHKKPLWDSKTEGKGARALELQNDGNLVIYNRDTNQVLWSSDTAGK